MTSYLKCAKNSPLFFNLLKEALEFILKYKDVMDCDAIQEKLRCLNAIASLLKRDVVMKYDTIVGYLI